MKISQAAEQAGCSHRMIRYYEKQGLLAAGRLTNGYRDYSPADVEKLRRIVILAESGLTVDAIREVLPCTDLAESDALPAYACPAARQKLQQQLEQIQQRIEVLSQHATAIAQILTRLEPLPN